MLAVPPIFVLIFRASDKALPADVRRDGAPTGRLPFRSQLEKCYSYRPAARFPPPRALWGRVDCTTSLFSNAFVVDRCLLLARGLIDGLGPGVGGFLAEGELMSRLHEVGVERFRFRFLAHNDPSLETNE